MTEIAVWVAGGVGLSIVLRAGALYSGTDRLAFVLVALIGAGLSLGIVELAVRARRALRFEREIERLPGAPTEADVEAASPEIRSVLRARIAGVPSAPAAQPYASYLLGLLVMIGLLGTFMGLFESLRGAREALGTSGDVAALRAALAAPMTGLSRAFGTSAAGVSASAMLGLALVIARRGESRAFAALSSYAAGPLARLTVARRTLDALEAIAHQGASLPAASEAMTRGAAALSDVAREVGVALERTTHTVGEDLRSVARSVREDLQGASQSSARAVAEAVSPRLEAAVTRVIETTAAQASATIARFDAASEARIAREATHAAALAERVERAVEAVVAAHREQAVALRDDVAREAKSVVDAVVAGRELLAEAEAERARTIAAAMTETAVAVGSRLEQTALEIGRTLSDTMTATELRLDALREAVARDTKSVIETVVANREQLADAEAERSRAVASALTDTAAAVGAQLQHIALDISKSLADALASTELALEAHRTHATEQDAARVARFDRVVERLESSAQSIGERFEGTAATFGESLAATARTIESRLTESTLASMTQFDALLARVDSSTASLDASLTGTAHGVTKVLVEAAEQMVTAQSLGAEQLSTYVEKLAAVRAELRADDDARAERIAEGTEARLEGLARTVSEALATSMEKVVASAQAAPEAAARVIAESADRLRAEAEANAERDARLELLVERLDALATAIDARGAEHTDKVSALTERLQETYAQSAAALEKGGVELTSTAELFGASVDKYREASDKWLTGLSVLRAAAERAAQGDAQDMLAAYLEQTREVFDHTLQFQRQLFNELRRVESREFAPPRLLPTGTEAEAEE